MKKFNDKVAVITGAASGIGRGIAEKFLREGMKIVLADIELDALTQTEKQLKKISPNVLSILTDVSKIGAVKALAQTQKFQPLFFIFNSINHQTNR